MNLLVILAIGWAFAATMMAVLYLVGQKRGEADIVDAGWASGIGIVGVLFLFLADGDPARKSLVALCVLVWSVRLASYLIVHRVLKPGEDGRYVALRKSWGDKANVKFFIFFQAQAIFVLIFSVPLLVAISNRTAGLTITDLLGVVVFCVALLGETVADRQLLSHRSNPSLKGKACRIGLWRYSRHPNYFFEWLHWWSYPLFACGGSYWIWTLVGPAFLLYLLVYVTGIPPTEARALESRGDDYREYQRTTSAFFPWPPRG